MLVLSRKVSEQVVVPQCQLTVTVLDVAGGRVRLGFSAPADVVVLRKEVVQWRPGPEGREQGEQVMSVRILIAEPDGFVSASYRDCLCQRGATVDTATTGLECLEKLREFAPDVLVLEPDLLWGGGDGVLAVIHEQPELRPAFVMLVSHASDRGLLHRVSRFKVDDYQIKPLTAMRLTNRIGKLLSTQLGRVTLEGVTAKLAEHCWREPDDAGYRVLLPATTAR